MCSKTLKTTEKHFWGEVYQYNPYWLQILSIKRDKKAVNLHDVIKPKVLNPHFKISDLVFTHFGVGTSKVSYRNFVGHSAYLA